MGKDIPRRQGNCQEFTYRGSQKEMDTRLTIETPLDSWQDYREEARQCLGENEGVEF